MLPIAVGPEAGDKVWREIIALTDRHRLTVYDATYLGLAQLRSLPLPTLDGDFRKAAQAEAIPLLDL